MPSLFKSPFDPSVVPGGTVRDRFGRWPGERVYSVVGWGLLVVAAGLVVYLFGVARAFPPSRAVGFRVVMTLILTFNLLWWRLADRRLARFVVRPRASAWLRVALAAMVVAVNVPVVQMFGNGRMPDYFNHIPTALTAGFTVWQLGLCLLLPSIALLRLVGIALRALVRAVSKKQVVVDELSLPDTGRRRFLMTACVSLPMVAVGASVVVARRQEMQLAVRRIDMAAPWLPERLRGLTITHVSDLHVGRHYRPYMLRRLVDAVGDLDSDLILVTGDLVDVSNEMLPPTMHALTQMPQRYGMFHCIGNHDQIDDRAAWVRAMRARFELLIDERRSLEIGGERLTIAGLDFARRGHGDLRMPGHDTHAHAMLYGHDAERDGPVIALAHHPHAFDALAARGVALTLAGHTHGGQLMLTAPESELEIGAGNFLFRYLRGMYRRDASTLFVNAGVGNWFPVRWNAPAEVVQLRLA